MKCLSKPMILVLLLFALWQPDKDVFANTRTLEFPFALSADPHSEFSASFPVLSAGQISAEAVWRNLRQQSTVPSLRLALLRPDGSEATRAEGNTPLTLHYRLTEQEVDSFHARRPGKWLMKVLNNSTTRPEEVSGKLRISVPASSRVLIETQFSLLGLGNAQEIPFGLIAPGRIIVETDWQIDGGPASSAPLLLSLIHSSQSRTLARKQGGSPLRIEYLATAQDLDSGNRWLIRVQNDNRVKIKGRLKVTYTPSL